jgi:signal transduction histidine kinase
VKRSLPARPQRAGTTGASVFGVTVALVVALILLAAAAAGLYLMRARISLLRAEMRAEAVVAEALRDRISGLERDVARLERDVTDGNTKADGLGRELSDLRDTNRKLAEAAEATVHDLREPLGTVLEFLEPLQNPRYSEQLDYRGKSYVRFARDAALRLRALIDGRTG